MRIRPITLSTLTLAAALAGCTDHALHAQRAQIARIQATLVAQALNMYLIDTGQSSPENGFDLTILTLWPDDGGGPGGPYLPKPDDIIDPWGNQLMVVSPGEINADFDVLSYGKDAAPGGEGVNEDITGVNTDLTH